MYKSLDFQKILSATHVLCNRVNERFPGSGLANVATEVFGFMTEVKETEKILLTDSWTGYLMKIGGSALIVITLFATILAAIDYRAGGQISITDFIQGVNSLLGTVVYAGLAILFVINFELKRKRKIVIRVVNQLKSMAHIIDMHQLSKDPEMICKNLTHTRAHGKVAPMTPFQLRKYLSYCIELLAMLGKIASFHAQRFNDALAAETVSDFERLTGDMAERIAQKISMIPYFEDKSNDEPVMDYP
jgi:hypothetical protein